MVTKLLSGIFSKNWQVMPQLDFTLDDTDNELFIDKYTVNDFEDILIDHGLLQQIERLGFIHPTISFELESQIHKVFLKAQKNEVDYMLMELCMRRITSPHQLRTNLTHSDDLFHGNKLKFTKGQDHFINSLLKLSIDKNPLHLLVVEWIRMENPTANFTATRQQLPGQNHPGLGQGKAAHSIICSLSEKNFRDGIASVPAYFHNALLYSMIGYKFGNPEVNGAFETLKNDLKKDIETKGLASVSYCFLHGKVKLRKTNQVVLWVVSEQIFPTSIRMKSYFETEQYIQMSQNKTQMGVYYIDWDSQPSLASNTVGFIETCHAFA